MTKLIRSPIQWNSGAMLGWNSNGKMAGIMRHPNKHPVQGDTERKNVTSSFFPQSGGNPAVSRVGGSKPRSTSRQRARREYVEPQKDFSPEFLDYIRSITNRDFEHATTVEDVLNNNVLPTKSVNNAEKTVEAKSMQGARRKYDRGNGNVNANVNVVHGYQLFTPSISQSATLPSRPSTVPRYLSRKEGGTRTDHNNRSILRPGGVRASLQPPEQLQPNLDEINNNLIRPLTKTRVTPNEVENEGEESPNREDFSTGEEQSTESASFTATPSESDRPSSSTSSCGSKRVTFAADVVNYERENKPTKKRKLPKRRRQGFPHPSRGIFVPPELEIVESTGPAGICRDNPYLTFNQVWTHPAARSTGETSASWIIRQERFHRIMNDLEHAHIHYNRLFSIEQNDYLIRSIFKRYVLVLDLALTEGHLTQVEHLLETISKSVPVLQQNTFYYLYGPKIIKDMEKSKSPDQKEDEHPDLVLTRYALARISGNLPRHQTEDMSIETVLVKLGLELIELVFSQYGSLEFRNALTTVPYTVRQAISLLKEIRTSKDAFCYVKWINNSAVQRDYRSILKNLGMLDKYGCKADISPSPSVVSVKMEGLVAFSQKSKSKIKRLASAQVFNKRFRTPPHPSPETVETTQTQRSTSS